nr:subtilisin-like protease [Colletotrichum truncatum]KAF6787530.1 subtilisin-like protease [Colletotrichum truncatum]
MWQLELLCQVIPAFGALGKEFIDRDHNDADLTSDANDCYSDIVVIGTALVASCGEWSPGLRGEEVERLLKVLESRLPQKWKPFEFIKTYAMAVDKNTKQRPFKKLHDIVTRIESHGLGGYNACAELSSQTEDQRQRYLDIIRQDMKVELFHGKEKTSKLVREKFITPIKIAATHLSNVYCRDRSTHGNSELSLSQHPSSGMRDAANRIYSMLERHWQCNCHQRATRPERAREARLSLIRHHILALKLSSGRTSSRGLLQKAKYEVLLPVCKEQVEWKVTNVEVNKEASCNVKVAHERHHVSRDICQWLKQSKGYQVDFMLENDKFWHLRPQISDDVDHRTIMEPLQQLLGNGMSISHIMRYTPKENLILCYVLANSMLFLYPGSWLHTAWNSSKVYFIRRANAPASKPVALNFPYLSVDMQEIEEPTRITWPHMQSHAHPSILALGILFLEIATGACFPRRPYATIIPTEEQCTDDHKEAWGLLKKLELQAERDRSKRISSTLLRVIRACIKLEPPHNIPSHSLLEEGPIRQYILSCIILPLASELVDGYKVHLEELHSSLEKELKSFDVTGEQRPNNVASVLPGNDLGISEQERDDPVPKNSERNELCLMADCGESEVAVDRVALSRTKEWFGYHQDILSRINQQLHDSEIPQTRKVRIAILDSGIELTPDHRDLYDLEPRISYRSWVDKDPEWRDDVGHGTHLAILLRKVAPNAAIYVARVFKKKPRGDASAQIIAEALRHAVDIWAVDIVVMSFGFGSRNDHLCEEIQKAAGKGVLMFAAASNGGKNRQDGISWPAREENVICVHSADGLGNRSAFTPSPRDNMRIMVLGECINSAWPEKLSSPNNHKHMSGTSCAAPIAAGIAATVLDYSRGFLSQKDWDRLRKTGPMRRMFYTMRDPDSHDGYWWIKHWTLFDPDQSDTWIQEEIKRYLS